MCNIDCSEDENPVSAFVINSLRGDIVQEKGGPIYCFTSKDWYSNIATYETIKRKSILGTSAISEFDMRRLILKLRKVIQMRSWYGSGSAFDSL
jgi:hypothetical protein